MTSIKIPVTFTESEADLLNNAMEILHRHGAKVSPETFIKKEALARAEAILKEKRNGNDKSTER